MNKGQGLTPLAMKTLNYSIILKNSAFLMAKGGGYEPRKRN